jgi:predicted small lipoprotein YifL
MKTVLLAIIVMIAAINFSSCGVLIPDYVENSERNSDLEYNKEKEIAKAEKRVLDSAKIVATKNDNNKFITDDYGRKLVLIANPNKYKSQKVTITDLNDKILYSGTLNPGQVVREYFFQTSDEKIYCLWEMAGKHPFLKIKDFPEGPAVMDYLEERCHAFAYGWP